MHERLQILPLNENESPLTLEVTSRQRLGGGHERKEIISANIHTKPKNLCDLVFRRRTIQRTESFVIRYLNPFSEKSPYAPVTVKEQENYLEIWKILHEIGFPVLPYVRMLSSGALLTTDMNALGYSIYGRGRRTQIENNEIVVPSKPTSQDLFFFDIYTSAHDELFTKMKQASALAAEHNICFDGLDVEFEIAIHESLMWRLIITDVRNMHIKMNHPIDRILQWSEYTVKSSLREIGTLYALLQGLYSHYI